MPFCHRVVRSCFFVPPPAEVYSPRGEYPSTCSLPSPHPGRRLNSSKSHPISIKRPSIAADRKRLKPKSCRGCHCAAPRQRHPHKKRECHHFLPRVSPGLGISAFPSAPAPPAFLSAATTSGSSAPPRALSCTSSSMEILAVEITVGRSLPRFRMDTRAWTGTGDIDGGEAPTSAERSAHSKLKESAPGEPFSTAAPALCRFCF